MSFADSPEAYAAPNTAPIEVPAMILGGCPSSSNTSSMSMCASPRAPHPPAPTAIEGRPTGRVGLRTCRAVPVVMGAPRTQR